MATETAAHDEHRESRDDVRSDGELVARKSAGDRAAFATLFRRHQRTVYRFALQMTGEPSAAEDITQDVFLTLARRADDYRAEAAALTTYLYGVARHLVLQRDRRQRRRGETELEAIDAGEIPAVTVDPMDGLARAARVRSLRRAILQLPAHYREVIVLCELNAVTYEDAARIVRCPVGTVRSRLNRARRLLADRCRAAERAAEDRAVTRLAQWRRYARLA